MDRFKRLLGLFAFLALLMPSAFATITPQSEIRFGFQPGGQSMKYGAWTAAADHVGACTSLASTLGGLSGFAGTAYNSSTLTTCVLQTSSGATFQASTREARSACPAHSTASGGVCVCDPSYREVSGACIPNVPCPTDLSNLEAQTTSVVENISEGAAKVLLRNSSSGNYAECSVDSCVIQRGSAICGGTTANVWRCEFYSGVATGTQCSASGSGGFYDGQAFTPTVPESSPVGTPTHQVTPAPPGPGMCPGEVNGQSVYVPCDRSISVTPTSSTTTSGSTTSTTTGETTVTCVGGTCTSVITGKTTTSVPNGSTVTSTTTPLATTTSVQSQDLFCRLQPDHPNCKPEAKSAFGGQCGGVSGTFTCSGDAATCAIARGVNEAKCLLTPSAAALTVAGQLEAGTFGPALTNTVKSVGQFSQTNPFSSSCPTNQVVTVAGASVTIPFADMCPWLQAMGNVLVAFTLLAATIFVLKGLGGT